MGFLPPQAPLPEPWPFDQPPNCAVFTTAHVMRSGQVITHAYHDDDDHGWQFHYPGDKSEADILVVALKEILHFDPTIAEIADLPPGYIAERKGIGATWERRKNDK